MKNSDVKAYVSKLSGSHMTVTNHCVNPFEAKAYANCLLDAADTVIEALPASMALEYALCSNAAVSSYVEAAPEVVDALRRSSYDALLGIIKKHRPDASFLGIEDLSAGKCVGNKEEVGFRATFTMKVDPEGDELPYNYRMVVNQFPAKTPLLALAAVAVHIVNMGAK